MPDERAIVGAPDAAPVVRWLVEGRGVCGTLRVVGEHPTRELADDQATALRERGLAVCVAWCRG